MIKKSLWVGLSAAFLLLIGSCQTKKKGTFTVSGAFENADKLTAVEGPISKVYLLSVTYGKDQPPVIVDSAKIPAGRGSFNLSGSAKGEQIFEVVFGTNIIQVPLVNDAPEVMVHVDLGKRDDFYDVKGSEASNQLKDLINVFGKKNFEVEKTMSQLDSLRQANAPDSLLATAASQKDAAFQNLNTFLKQFINTCPSPTVAAVALTWASRSFPKGDFELSLNDMMKKYPDNAVVNGLKTSYEQQLAQIQQQQSQDSANSWVGKQVPDFALPDVEGHPVSLASYRGKYLLVDFWASWCGPCRAENPNVVKVHNEFKNKNFAILGVSLDKERAPWQEAVHADNLDWKQVSDLKYWNSSAVATFKFEGIPFNLLIDPTGKVIATGLRGEELENKLKQVLN
jgi:peroxiredoxin